MAVPILFLADTHLGLDLPTRPRGERNRRGEDFFAAFESALAPAWRGETDLVVHGGDLFYRSQIPAWLAARVYARLAALADHGVDILWVAGNHERSGAPRGLLLDHPRIHVFDRPRTFVLRRQGLDIAFVGFPFAPRARTDFAQLLAATGHRAVAADVRLLCLHQAVEGATVGPANFTFRDGADVVRGADLPAGFAAVLSGHIHRPQTLRNDLAGRPLAAPVLYPGSTERTSFAERDEAKGALWLAVEADGAARGQLSWQFRPLAARPMAEVELDPRGDATLVSLRLAEALARLDPRSVVRVRLRGEASPEALPALRAEALRRAAPASMHVTVAWPRAHEKRPGPLGRS
jgi:DNA repair exonuclease SbcCD nuclease subunit